MVHDGSKAIEQMLAYRPHLIILDLELPKKNGFEIFQEMRLHSELRDIPVVANSIHMGTKDDLGQMFFNAYILSKQEDPLYVNKLESDERMCNNLTAVVGVALSQKYQMLPRKLIDFLENMSNEQQEKRTKEEKRNKEKFSYIQR